MAKAAHIALAVDVIPHQLVNLIAALSGGQGFTAQTLSLQNGIVHLAHFCGRLAQGHGTGHVGTIAAHLAAHVQGNQDVYKRQGYA